MVYWSTYVSRIRQEFDRLNSVTHEGDQRRREFCRLCMVEFQRHHGAARNPLIHQVLRDLMNCKDLFPSVRDAKYFFKFALDRRSLIMIKLLKKSGVKIHELCLENRHSALHYLAEVKYRKKFEGDYVITKIKTIEIIEYFLNKAQKNYQDSLGYTYFHGACMSGNVSAVNTFLSQGVDVNLETYTCSPLHIAAQYRHSDVIEILLRHGADPNKLDAEKSTPLHALARLCLCPCTEENTLCDKRKPVDKLVKLLLDHGANIEARNRHGNTPLGLSVSRLDLQLTRTFLKYGAKIENLNEDEIFKMTFTPLELKNYPLTLDIIEMSHLLKSAGYNLSLQARLRMMKYWMQIRGNDTDHLISDYTEFLEPVTTSKIIKEAMQRIFLSREFGFYLPQETEDVLLKKCKYLDPFNNLYEVYKPRSSLAETLTAEIERTKEIMLTKDISLYEMLRMSYSEGYSLIKGIKNWRLPAMDDISCTRVNIMLKRHMANVMIRQHLERLIADLFMTDHCQLDLPYLACLKIAEHMSDEDLFRLFEQKNENQLRPNTMRRRKRCDESGSSASSEPSMRQSRRLRS